MTNKRLNGLSMMFVHQNLASCLDVQNVVDKFCYHSYHNNHLHDLGASKDNFD